MSDHDIINNEFNTDKGISVSPLFPFDSITNIEVLCLTLAPSYQHTSEAHNIGTIEHILVIKGEMEYLVDNQWLPLQQNEVTKFNADKVHGYRNVSDQEAIFHNIIYYAKK
ncbi:cupin domain-containing protein [Psychromonas sp. KJ10-10]|uniref:cupin domain-containing protein n=1 Tax=Psychromonas sp. KJ10-10 TaxID=3391823 RepID=UPI0039B43385